MKKEVSLMFLAVAMVSSQFTFGAMPSRNVVDQGVIFDDQQDAEDAGFAFGRPGADRRPGQGGGHGRPGMPGHGGHGPGRPGHPGGGHGPGHGPGYPGPVFPGPVFPGPYPGPGYGVVCYARNARGQRFGARGFDWRRTQERAMDLCYRSSVYCFRAGCR